MRAQAGPRGRTLYVAGAVTCIATLLGLWQWASTDQSSVVLPGPVETFAALWSIALDGSLVTELAVTLGRAALATALALAAGALLGWGAYLSVFLDGAIAPVRAVLQGLPPIVLIVCLVLWLGSDPVITVVVCSSVMTPVIAVATAAALRSVDVQLVELGQAFGLSRIRRWLLILAPGALPPVLAAGGAVASGSVRVTVMAELLSAPNGVGAAIAQNRTLLQTPELFAWTVAIVASALLVDIAIRTGVRRLSTRRTADLRASDSDTISPGIREGIRNR